MHFYQATRSIFFAGCILVLIEGTTFSQQAFPEQVDTFAIARSVNHQAGHYSFDGSGRLNTGSMQTIAPTNALFFGDEIIQLEIELVDEQKAKFNSIVKKWQTSWEKTIREIQADYKKSPLSQEEVKSRIAENDETSLSKIRKVLLPHQLAIINELQLRCLLRTQGIKTILESPEFHELLNLKKPERDKILSTAKSLRQKVLQKSIEVRKKTLAILFEPLSKDEVRTVAEKWKHLFEDKNQCSLEELIIFLDPERYAWINEKSEPIKKLIGRPNFETGAAGNLVSKPGGKYPNEELQVFRSFWVIRHQSINEDFVRWVGLTEDEKLDVQELIKASYPSSQFILEMGNETTKTGQKVASDKMESMQLESITAIKELLGDERWGRVETFAERINLASAGPVYDLIEGELSKRLKFSRAKKDTLKRKSAESLKYLTQETAKIEEFFLDEMASTLDENRSKKFKAAFGRPVKNAPVNIDLMLMNLWR